MRRTSRVRQSRGLQHYSASSGSAVGVQPTDRYRECWQSPGLRRPSHMNEATQAKLTDVIGPRIKRSETHYMMCRLHLRVTHRITCMSLGHPALQEVLAWISTVSA